MIVVLDTEPIRFDYLLNATTTRILLENMATAGIELVIPAVVLREHIAHFRADLATKVSKLQGNIGSLKKHIPWSGPNLSIQLPDLEEQVSIFEGYLTERLGKFAIEVLPLPQVSHDVLVDRDLKGRKPFDGHGKGYRDAL